MFGLIVAKGPPWSRKEWILKTPPPWAGNSRNLSGPQAKACIALGDAAFAAYGTTGKTHYKGVNMPSVAVKVATVVPKGEGIHGGKTQATRRKEAHDAARASIDSLRALVRA
jgi:hypothetical protein